MDLSNVRLKLSHIIYSITNTVYSMQYFCLDVFAVIGNFLN